MIAATPRHALLTEREFQVIACLSHGLRYKGTADLLGISVRTVSVHARNVFDKLDVHKISDVVRIIYMG